MPRFKEDDIINNRYRVERLLGKGGFSKVYKTYDLQTEKVCAIKVLKQEEVENNPVIQRFQKEAHILKELNHPNIIRIYDIYFSTDIIFYVMEYLEGENLAEFLLKNKAQQPAWALAIIKQLLNAIGFLHQKGILHRDLKPSNIILLNQYNTKESAIEDTLIIKVIDFGIAKAIDEETTKTADEFLGTPLYMAPERLGRSACSCSSDIYSIGEILWHIITGEARCKGLNIETLMELKKKNPDFKFFINECSKRKETRKEFFIAKEWIKKAMHPDPNLRFQTCKDALEFIEKPGVRFKILRKKIISRAALIIGLLIVLAGIIVIPGDYFVNKQLYNLKIEQTYVIGMDKKGNNLWEFESAFNINDANILKNLSPTRKEAVLITTAEVSQFFNNAEVSVEGGQIWLLNSKGKKIWMQQLGGKEWIPGSGTLYNARFRLAEDIDNDNRKELIFTSSNYLFYPGFLIIFKPDDGSFYGSYWNSGNDFRALNILKKDSIHYLSLISFNNSLETEIITRLAVNKSFQAISPGWTNRNMAYIEKAGLSFTKSTASMPFGTPHIFIHEIISNKLKDETISIEKIDKQEIIMVHGNDTSYYYNWEGYPTDASGKELYPRSTNALSPDEFLWKLNPYFTYSDEKIFQKAVQLCQDLISRTPNISQYYALIYMLLGKAQLNLGDRKSAIENFNKSLAIKHDMNRAQIHLIEALILDKRLDEAQKLLNENYARIAKLDYDGEPRKYMMYLDDLEPKKEIQSYSSSMKKYKIFQSYLKEQQLCYAGSAEAGSLSNYDKFELTDKFWRWHIAREVLLQHKALKESWKQVPSIYYQDSGLAAIRSLIEPGANSEGLALLEKEALGNLESYQFLSAAYLLYADHALKNNDKINVHEYAQKALNTDAIGFLRVKAKEIIKGNK